MSLRSWPDTSLRFFSVVGGLLFAASLLHAAFVYVTAFGRTPAPWSLALAGPAIAHNTLLFALFALHHSLFARLGVKAWIVGHTPASMERSIYVWCASLLFALLMWGWVDVPGVAWTATGLAALLLASAQMVGLIVTGLASRHIGVLRLAGVQPPTHVPSISASPPALKRDGLYGFVRHPIYFAWLLLVWPTPVMTGSRLLFAIVTTAYLALAIPFEERALRREFGSAYDDYRRHVRWRMVPGIY